MYTIPVSKYVRVEYDKNNVCHVYMDTKNFNKEELLQIYDFYGKLIRNKNYYRDIKLKNLKDMT
ncbi:MAG: hypothetical protein ABSG25_09235 [Bryobacteraceae bacterium]|jgi:hypothetical protein